MGFLIFNNIFNTTISPFRSFWIIIYDTWIGKCVKIYRFISFFPKLYKLFWKCISRIVEIWIICYFFYHIEITQISCDIDMFYIETSNITYCWTYFYCFFTKDVVLVWYSIIIAQPFVNQFFWHRFMRLRRIWVILF